MYIYPQPHKCIRCGHEFMYGPHDGHSAPTTSDGVPACPACWDRFLETVGLGYATTKWTEEGSKYEQALTALRECLKE